VGKVVNGEEETASRCLHGTLPHMLPLRHSSCRLPACQAVPTPISALTCPGTDSLGPRLAARPEVVEAR